MASSVDVAIIGMACVFPGAPDLATYWRNICSGKDAISDVPSHRWDPVFYDPKSSLSDRLYCKRGGFIDEFATFDPTLFGIMPVAAEGAEPDQLLTLAVATKALEDAGYAARSFPRSMTGVILGRGNYAGAGRTRLEQHVRTAEQLVRCLRTLVPNMSESELANVKHEFQKEVGAKGVDAAIGLVPNLTASRLAHRLDLHGPAYTVDAACASSLVAVDQACALLQASRCDMVITGGVHLCHDEAFWSVFCQLGALSRSQQIRPFDQRADGILIGEGVGITILKRLADAERDGDRVYAVIRGTGVASDGREVSLMTPGAEGQQLALERAWNMSGLDPVRVGLLEAHGTGTSAGDAAELETLRAFFGAAGDGERAVIGSVKSMIGHTMPAAGAAGLIKAALAVHYGTRPPTLHCEEPRAELQATRFRVLSREEDWETNGELRCAGVNAFGFGGINAHVVLEQVRTSNTMPVAAVLEAKQTNNATCDVSLYAASSKEELLFLLDRGEQRRTGGPFRLAITEPTPAKVGRARTIVERGRAWRGREGIWFSPEGLLSRGGRLVFAFPGVDSSFEPHVEDVAAFARRPIPPFTKATNLEEVGAGIIGVNRLLFHALSDLGVKADMMLGHSIGEWSGMIASGMIPDDFIDPFMTSLVPGSLQVPGVVFAAAGCAVDVAERAMQSLDRIGISHDNCPHQVIFCGDEDAVDVALARLRADGVLCQKLPFQSGFHSPLFADYLGPHRSNFEKVPLQRPRVQLWSATSFCEYPHEPEAIRALALDHLVQPVRFRTLIESMYARDARVFVQVGTGSLVHFIEDTLRGREHAAISVNVKERSGMVQLIRTAALLFAEGSNVRWEKLLPNDPSTVSRPMTLSLGVPLVQLPKALADVSARPSVGKRGHHPVVDAFSSTMEELRRAQLEVFAKFDAIEAPDVAEPARELTIVRTLSVEAFPEFLDHSFFRQAEGWPNVADWHAVVPMTGSIDFMIEAAKSLVLDRVVVAVEDVRALRWLVVSKPIEVKITCRLEGTGTCRVHVAIDGYCEAIVVFGDEYGEPPSIDLQPLADETPTPVTASELYRDRWMFHGKAFQGIVDMGTIGRDGIRGELQAGAARGALLDNAGQLFGFWVMQKNEVNRLAMPVQIDRIRFYGPPPSVGDRLSCTVRIRKQDLRQVVADISLGSNSHVWAMIEGWEDRRFDTDARLWSVMIYPESNLLAEPHAEGFVLFTDTYASAPTRDQLSRRFLNESERKAYEAQTPRGQRAWLNGRIAGKDAIRDYLWKRGHGSLFPAEITIANDSLGRPIVESAIGKDLQISIAHKGELAVAMVSDRGAMGIDIEKIEPRSAEFASLAFSEDELRLLGDLNRDEWLTRFWCAKEAVGKARGTGLKNNPRHIRIRDRAGEILLVEEFSVETRQNGAFIISWVRT